MGYYRSASGSGGTTSSWSSSPGGGAGGGAAAAGGGAFGGLGSMLGSMGNTLLVAGVSSGLGSLLGRSEKKKAKRKLADYMAKQDAILTAGTESAKDTVRRNLVDGKGQIGQSLVDRGLYNSSVLDTMGQVADQNAAAEIAGLQERKAQTLSGIMQEAEASLPTYNYGAQIGGILSDAMTKTPTYPGDNQNDAAGGLGSMLAKRGAPAAVAAGQVADSDAARQTSLASLTAGDAVRGVPGMGGIGGIANILEYGRKGVSGLGRRARRMYPQD